MKTSFPVTKAVIARAIFSLCSCLLAPCTTASSEEWRLIYTVTQEESKIPAGAGPSEERVRSFTRLVILGREHLVVEDDERKTVYDFRHKRWQHLQRDKNVYDDLSLYWIVGFRVSELRNRYYLDAISDSLSTESPLPPFGRFDSETVLALELPQDARQPEPMIERVSQDRDGLEFRHDGQSVVRFVPATTQLPEPFYRRFVNFLAYECHLHPRIRRQMIDAGQIPRQLVLRSRELPNSTTTSYVLHSVEQSESDSTAMPGEARSAEHADDPLFRVLSLARDKGRSTRRLAREDAARYARQAVADKRHLDGYLALVEYVTQSSERLDDEFKRHRRKFERDSLVQRYQAGGDQSTPEACQKRLGALESIDRSNLEKAHMLDLDRANLLAKLGQSESAEELFLKVLEANPFHSGAYHDLGVLYYNTYEHWKAWLCFDTGRQLYPEHILLQEVTEMEQRFLRDFPDFF